MVSFIERGRVPEFFISGTAYIDDLGDGNHRFALFTKMGQDQIVCCKIVAATPTIYVNLQQAMTHLGYRCCGAQRMRVAMN